MTLNELTKAVAAATGYKKLMVYHILAKGFSQIQDCITSGEAVSIHGFGRFESKDKVVQKACFGSEDYATKPGKRCKFTPSRTFIKKKG